MHSASFITNTGSSLQQLDDFRKDVREKAYNRFENSKQVLASAKEGPNQSLMFSILRRSISPKSPRHIQFSPQRHSPTRISFQKEQQPIRLSFQRGSLDLGKSSASTNQQNSLLTYPKKNLADLIPLNRIIDMQKLLKSLNYTANENYMNELKKLARQILQE